MSNESDELIPVADADETVELDLPYVQARWCKHCDTAVIPVDRGVCPVCRRYVRGNESRVGERPRGSRIDVLSRELQTEFKPASELDRSLVNNLVRTCERLERIKPGSLEHVRLVKAQRDLVASLNESRRTRGGGSGIDAEQLEAARGSLARKLEAVMANIDKQKEG